MYRFLVTGTILSLISVWGIVYAIQASLAQVIYHHTKFGRDASRFITREINTRCEDAYNFYKHNYYFSILLVEKAWHEYVETNDEAKAKELLALANKWCEIGLKQNKYRSQLRLLKARLLFIESPVRGIEYWKEYVEWDFWNPYNHAVLVEMYIDSGEYERALKTLELIRSFQEATPLFARLREVWEREVHQPPAVMSSASYHTERQ